MDLTIFQNIDYRALLLMGGVLVLFVLFLFGHKKQQQRIRSGNEVARKEGQNINNQFNINLPFYITRPGIWCRISTDFEFISEAKHGLVKHYEQSQHQFELGLKDQTERTLINEAQPFRTFLGFTWSRSKQYSYVVGARTSSRHHAEGLPLLEFIPPHAGRYSITFKIPVTETINNGAFQYESRFTQFALSVKEDVLAMKARAYPHKKIDLRQAVGVGASEK